MCFFLLQRQLLAGFIALLLYLQVGVGDGFSSVLLPQLQSKYSALQITDDESSWIGKKHDAIV